MPEKILDESFQVIICFHEMTVIFHLPLIILGICWNIQWIHLKMDNWERQERLIRRVVFLCEAVNLALFESRCLNACRFTLWQTWMFWGNKKLVCVFFTYRGEGKNRGCSVTYPSRIFSYLWFTRHVTAEEVPIVLILKSKENTVFLQVFGNG